MMKHNMNLQLFAVDANTVTAADLAKVRDVDFAERFTAGIETLMKMLGVTRKIEKKAGEVLKVYKVTGTLEDGAVRYLDFKSFAEVDRLTIPEYTLLMEAVRLKTVDMDYRNHLQAYLNYAVKAEKKTGKNKTKPVYSTFKKFFDYEKAIKNAKNNGETQSRFSGIGKLLKKGG